MEKKQNKKLTSRKWTITIYNFDEIIGFHDEHIRYAAYGDEICPRTGREHKQGFLYTWKPVRLTQLKKIFPTSHLEIMIKDFATNEAYCSKMGLVDENGNKIYTEIGNKPMTAEEKGELGADYWIRQVIQAEIDPSMCEPKLQITHYGNLQKIHERAKRKRKLSTLDVLEHEWLVGESGSGKSSTARRENPDAYIKQCNKWWCGYDDQDVVIIDDLDTTHEWMAYSINQWADHYPFPAEIKGSGMTIRPRKFIITSRYMPDQIFKDPSTIQSINRRFKFRHFPENK